MDKHKQETHKELLKRKIEKEQPHRCYICGFQSISETAFAIHTEESHGQIYSLTRTNSITKSPPLKKVKEFHLEDMEIDQSERMQKKNEEIVALQSKVKELQEKLLTRGANEISRKALEPIVNIIEVLEEEVDVPKTPKTTPAPRLARQGLIHKLPRRRQLLSVPIDMN